MIGSSTVLFIVFVQSLLGDGVLVLDALVYKIQRERADAIEEEKKKNASVRESKSKHARL
jgi:hypothetical protein